MQETLNEVMVLVDHATQDTSCLKVCSIQLPLLHM